MAGWWVFSRATRKIRHVIGDQQHLHPAHLILMDWGVTSTSSSSTMYSRA